MRPPAEIEECDYFAFEPEIAQREVARTTGADRKGWIACVGHNIGQAYLTANRKAVRVDRGDYTWRYERKFDIELVRHVYRPWGGPEKWLRAEIRKGQGYSTILRVSPARFPPVVAVRTRYGWAIGDGHHRIAAQFANGRKTIHAIVGELNAR